MPGCWRMATKSPAGTADVFGRPCRDFGFLRHPSALKRRLFSFRLSETRFNQIKKPRSFGSAAAIEKRSEFPEGFLDDLLEIVFTRLDDAEFASGIIGGVAGVRGVDHDGGAEFAADAAGL